MSSCCVYGPFIGDALLGKVMSTTHWPKSPLDGTDINVLSGILRQWCTRHQCDFDGEASQAKARELVQWFEFGVKDPSELTELIEGKHWQVHSI